MNRAEGLDRLARSRSGHLATVRPDGRPHVVVITFALLEQTIVTAIDHKPKMTQRLQRLVNIERTPQASFLADHFEEDWHRLWWVRVDGTGEIHTGGEMRDHAIEALVSKYAQYRETPPEGPVIAISIERVSSWEGTG